MMRVSRRPQIRCCWLAETLRLLGSYDWIFNGLAVVMCTFLATAGSFRLRISAYIND